MCQLIKERKTIEERIIHRLCRDKNTEIKNLERGYNGRILSFSPYKADNDTNKGNKFSIYTNYKYSNLSKALHKYSNNERTEIEREINKLIPLEDHILHIFFTETLNTRINIRRYCDSNRIPMLSNNQINRLWKLIEKWRDLSQNIHYSMTKQEKRKIKRIYKRTIKKLKLEEE